MRLKYADTNEAISLVQRAKKHLRRARFSLEGGDGRSGRCTLYRSDLQGLSNDGLGLERVGVPPIVNS